MDDTMDHGPTYNPSGFERVRFQTSHFLARHGRKIGLAMIGGSIAFNILYQFFEPAPAALQDQLNLIQELTTSQGEMTDYTDQITALEGQKSHLQSLASSLETRVVADGEHHWSISEAVYQQVNGVAPADSQHSSDWLKGIQASGQTPQHLLPEGMEYPTGNFKQPLGALESGLDANSNLLRPGDVLDYSHIAEDRLSQVQVSLADLETKQGILDDTTQDLADARAELAEIQDGYRNWNVFDSTPEWIANAAAAVGAGVFAA